MDTNKDTDTDTDTNTVANDADAVRRDAAWVCDFIVVVVSHTPTHTHTQTPFLVAQPGPKATL